MTATTKTLPPSLASVIRYTFDDMHAGRCTFADVGEPVRDSDEPATHPSADPPHTPHQNEQHTESLAALPLPSFADMSDAEIAQTSVRLLREATIEVFHKMGAADWLYQLARTDPKSFLRMLQRLLPQSIEANVNVTSFEVPAHIRTLSVEDLKAMRATPSLASAIDGAPIDVDFIEVTHRGLPR